MRINPIWIGFALTAPWYPTGMAIWNTAHASREAPGFEAAAPEPSIGVPLSATDAALITFYKCGVRDQIITDQIDLYKRIGKTFVPPADKQCDAIRQFVADHGMQD